MLDILPFELLFLITNFIDIDNIINIYYLNHFFKNIYDKEFNWKFFFKKYIDSKYINFNIISDDFCKKYFLNNTYGCLLCNKHIRQKYFLIVCNCNRKFYFKYHLNCIKNKEIFKNWFYYMSFVFKDMYVYKNLN